MKFKVDEVKASMAGTVGFFNLGKAWNFSNGAYEVVLGTAFECYLDQAKAPQFAAYCRDAFGRFLSETWPDRYKDLPKKLEYVIEMDRDFTRSEQEAALDALSRLLKDFENNAACPNLGLDRELQKDFAARTSALIELMRQSLATPQHDEGSGIG